MFFKINSVRNKQRVHKYIVNLYLYIFLKHCAICKKNRNVTEIVLFWFVFKGLYVYMFFRSRKKYNAAIAAKSPHHPFYCIYLSDCYMAKEYVLFCWSSCLWVKSCNDWFRFVLLYVVGSPVRLHQQNTSSGCFII